MSKLIVEKRFKSLGNNEMLMTFRNNGQLESIPSASTIFFDRDHTHTRIQSDLKITSNKPTADHQIYHYHKRDKDSEILSYSKSASSFHHEEMLIQLNRLLHLFDSKDNIANHIANSIGLIQSQKITNRTNIGTIIAESFVDYVNIAQNINVSFVREVATREERINRLNHELSVVKHQNAELFQKCVQFQENNNRLRKKISETSLVHENKLMSNLLGIISVQNQKIIQKMKIFQAQIYDKLGKLQKYLIGLSNWRNNIIQNKVKNLQWREQTHKYQSINKQLHKLIQNKQDIIQKLVLKENTAPNYDHNAELEKCKKQLQQKTTQINALKSQFGTICQQLSDHKKLYEQMLDKNIQLQKQMIFLSQKMQGDSDNQSLHIIQHERDLSYFTEHDLSNSVISSG